MYTILVQDDNTLQTSIRARIMQNSKNVDEIHFLVKPNYNEIDMAELKVILTYIMPISKERKTLTLVSDSKQGVWLSQQFHATIAIRLFL